MLSHSEPEEVIFLQIQTGLSETDVMLCYILFLYRKAVSQ